MIQNIIVVPNRSANLRPFQLVKISSTKVGFVQGTVNGMIAQKIGGGELSADYTENEITVGANQTYYLKVNVSDETITSAQITTSDPGSDSKSQTSQALGSVTFADGKITAVSSLLNGSVNILACDGNYSWRS